MASLARALARLTGVNIETIRYYEKIELMRKPPRTYGEPFWPYSEEPP